MLTCSPQTMIRWKLRSVMADRKMTGVKLAKLMGLNRVTVSGWANSDEIPNFADTNGTLDSLCRHLNCTPSDLIQYSRDEESQ